MFNSDSYLEILYSVFHHVTRNIVRNDSSPNLGLLVPNRGNGCWWLMLAEVSGPKVSSHKDFLPLVQGM